MVGWAENHMVDMLTALPAALPTWRLAGPERKHQFDLHPNLLQLSQQQGMKEQQLHKQYCLVGAAA